MTGRRASELRLVARVHVDLRRQASALCTSALCIRALCIRALCTRAFFAV